MSIRNKEPEMATKARIRRKFQVTIPEEVRKSYPLEEGQTVSVEATPHGILITSVAEIDPSQAWFWSPRWRAMETAADADFAGGRVAETESADAAIRALKKNATRKS
jgi:AbrB family looped-hinge helix DNA binding protein